MATKLQTLPPASKREAIFDLSGIDESGLYLLMTEVEAKLPLKYLKDVSLEQELVRQLRMTQLLQIDVIDDPEVPANQRAQTANAVAAILHNLAKLQTEVYTSERLKTIEAILIETLKTLPEEQQRRFMEEYVERLSE